MSKLSDLFIKIPCEACDGTGKITVSKLSVLRKKAGLDQATVAEQLGLTRTSISNMELGRQQISIDKIGPLAELYGIDEFEMYKVAAQLSGIIPKKQTIDENDL